ncbi:MAG: PAS domain S-box protein [Anaerolineales bacterium]
MNKSPLFFIRIVLKILAVALIYYITARLGFLIALPPGNVTALWPPSGLALAAILIWGWPMGIGVFLGSFFVNIGVLSGSTAFPVAITIAVGSTLQAFCIAWLFRKFIKILPPDTVRDTLIALAITALTTLIAPLFGVTSLCVAKIAPWSQYLNLTWTWWLGDVIGILIFTPPLFVFYHRLKNHKVREALLWPFTSFVIGLTLFVFFVVENVEQHQMQSNLQRDTEEMTRVLDSSINQDIQHLVAISSFYSSVQTINKDQFFSFTQPLLANSSAISGLSLVPHVLQVDRLSYEQAIRSQGNPNFYIYEKDAQGNNIPVGERLEYFPVTLIEPLKSNSAAVGFDIGSNLARMETINYARDTGNPSITPPIHLVQETGSQAGILVMVPIYRNGMPLTTIEERRANFIGLANGVYRMDVLVNNALNEIDKHDIELYMYDVEDSSTPQYLTFYPSISGAQSLSGEEIPSPGSLEKGLYSVVTLQVGGRDWLVISRPGPKYETTISWWVEWVVLAVGFMVAGIFLVYVNVRQETEAALSKSENEFRTLSEHSLTGIMRQRVSGEILYANESFARMLGFESAENLLSKSLRPYISKPSQFLAMLQMLHLHGQVRDQEIDILTVQGEMHYLLCSASLSGDVVTATVVDITERLRAEQEIRQLSRIVSQMADTVVITNKDGLIEYVNPAFEEVTGYNRLEVTGKTPRVVKSGLHPLEFYEKLWDTILQGNVFYGELTNRKKNGELYYETKTITPIRDIDGVITHFVATGKDITEHRKIEQALSESKLLFHLLIESLPQNIYAKDVNGRFIFANHHYCATEGKSLENIVGKTDFELHPSEMAEKYLADDRWVIETGKAIEMVEEHQPLGEEKTFVQVIKTPFYDSTGQTSGTLGIFWDITKRRQDEILQETVYQIAEAVHASNSLQDLYPKIHHNIASVMDAKNFFIALYDEKNDLLRFDYSVDEKDQLREPVSPGTGLTAYVLRTGKSLLYSHNQNNPDIAVIGTPPVVWLGVPLIVHDKTIGVMAVQSYENPKVYKEREQRILEFVSSQIAVAIDRKRTEEVVNLIEKRNHALIENVPGGIALLDVKGIFLFCSPSAYRMFDYTPEEIIGSNSLALTHPDDVALVRSGVIDLLKDSSKLFVIEYRFMHKDGSYRWIECTFSNLLEESGVNAIVNNFRDITERKLADELLKKSQMSLEMAQSVAHLGSWEIDAETGLESWSKEMFQLFRWNPHLGVPTLVQFLELIHPDDRSFILNSYQQVLQTDERIKYEYRAVLPENDLHYFEASLQSVRNKQGKVGVTGTVLDITETRRSEKALQLSDERFRQLAENILEVFWLYDVTEERIIYISPAYEIVWARTCQSLYQHPNEYIESILPEDKVEMFSVLEKQSKGERTEIEYRVQRPDGSIRWVWDRGFPIFDEAGKLVRTAGIATDITEVKNTEAELQALNRDLEKRVEERTMEVRQNEALYRALFENSNDGIFLLSPTGEELSANQKALDLIGYTADEYAALSKGQVNAVALPEQRQDGVERLQAVLDGKSVPLYERTLVTKDGTKVEVEINLSAVRDDDGKIILVQSVVRDVTDRKKAETALRESEERYRRAISAADAVPYSLDYATNKYIFIGEGIERITGYAHDEMTPELFDSFIQETEMRGDFSNFSTHESTRLIRSGKAPSTAVWRSDFLILNKNGKKRWLSDSSVQIVDKNGHPVGSMGILQDITERKTAEENLRQSRDQLSAANAALEKASHLKDEFLASMSHELRTPLTGILGLSEALQLQTYGLLNEKQLNVLKHIQGSGRHLLDLINDILDLSKIEADKLDMQFEICSVADICQASLQLVKGMAHQKNQNISFSMNPASISIRADARRLKQMLVNLLSNAVKFTPESGQLGLEVQIVEDKSAIQLVVWDKGIGIKATDMDKLFKPFMQIDSSLARQYTGTGLGLSLVQRMAELHGGSVKVESVYGDGSRFTILLPLSETQIQPVIKTNSKETSPLTRKVLFVQEGGVDLKQITAYLKEMGITNVIQSELKGALEMAISFQPKVILLDLNSADEFGINLLSQLVTDKRTRAIPVIILSEKDHRQKVMELGALGYLTMPCSQQSFHDELGRIVGAPLYPPASSSFGSTPVVLIADDNELILTTITDFLVSQGFQVITTRSGFELLERAPEFHPDVMIVDIQMPGMDGMETMRRVRAHHDPKVASTPMIALTALAMTGDREKCLQAGANEYMSKPLVLSQLVEKIKEYLMK